MVVNNKTLKMINALEDKNPQLRTDILATLYTIHRLKEKNKSKRRSRSRSRKRRSKSNKSRKSIKSRSRSRSNCKYGRKKTGRKGCKSKPGPKSRSRSRKSRKSRKQHKGGYGSNTSSQYEYLVKGGHRSSVQHGHLNGGKKKSRSKTRRSLSKKSLTQKKRMITQLLNKICKINNMTGGGIPQITGGCNAKCSR